MTIYEKLQRIHSELKCPKNLWNDFSSFNYRNLESIFTAFKPFEKKYNVILLVNDEVVSIGSWNYVKATATLYDIETEATVSAYGYAREPEVKKGMDAAQITGTSSSYARKYACGALFQLDDTKDADSDPATKEMIATLKTVLDKAGKKMSDVKALQGVNKKDPKSFTVSIFKAAMEELEEE